MALNMAASKNLEALFWGVLLRRTVNSLVHVRASI